MPYHAGFYGRSPNHSITRIQLGDGGSTGTYSISGGDVNVSTYIKSWNAAGKSTFEVDGSGATDIEIGQLSLVGETLRINLDSGGSTLIEIDNEGNYSSEGLELNNATFALGGSGFSDGVYDIAWAVNGIDTTGMTFSNLSDRDNADLSWAVVSTDFGAGAVDTLQVTVIPEPAALGMVAVFGGGIFFIRKMFMI